MTPQALAAFYPRLYHLTHAANLPGVRARGLLSASALMELFAVPADLRLIYDTQLRAAPVPLDHPEHGRATLADQHAMEAKALAGCVEGMTPGDYLSLLNRRVFFWGDPERLRRMHKPYRKVPMTLFVVDALKLLTGHAEKVQLTRINSGFANSFYRPAKRGAATFTPLDEFPEKQVKKVAEITVLGGVPLLADLLEEVRDVPPGGDLGIDTEEA